MILFHDKNDQQILTGNIQIYLYLNLTLLSHTFLNVNLLFIGEFLLNQNFFLVKIIQKYKTKKCTPQTIIIIKIY